MSEWRKWFDSRLDDAIEAAATADSHRLERKQILNLYFFDNNVCVYRLHNTNR